MKTLLSTIAAVTALNLLGLATPAYAELISTAKIPLHGGFVIFDLYDEPSLIPECRGKNASGAIANLEKDNRKISYGTGCWTADANGYIHLFIKSLDDGLVRETKVNNTKFLSQKNQQKEPPQDILWYVQTDSGTCRAVTLADAINGVEKASVGSAKSVRQSDGSLYVYAPSRDGGNAYVQIYSSCEKLPHLPSTSSPDVNKNRIITPVGWSPAEVRSAFGVNPNNCRPYSFGRGFGCTGGLDRSQDAPIKMADGYTPCQYGKPVTFDFVAEKTLTSVGCHATEEKWRTFLKKMTAANGAGKFESAKDGGFVSGESTTWIVGGISVSAVKKLFGSEERYLVYAGEVGNR